MYFEYKDDNTYISFHFRIAKLIRKMQNLNVNGHSCYSWSFAYFFRLIYDDYVMLYWSDYGKLQNIFESRHL